MGKTELVEFIAAKAGLSKADALRAVDAFVEGVVEGLKEPLHIPAKTVASFKAGSKLKDALN